MFSAADAQWLSDSVLRLYASETPAEMTHCAIAALHRRFRLVMTGGEQISLDGSRYTLHGIRTEVAIPPDYAAYIHDHPTFPMVKERRADPVIQLSQVVSRSTWERTDHFNGVARRTNFVDQIILLSQGASDFFTLGLFRDRVFSRDEFRLAGLLQTHLDAAWRRVRPPLPPLDQSLIPRIDLTWDLKPVFAGPNPLAVLRAYFPTWRAVSAFPDTLRAWLEDSGRALQQTPPSRALFAFRIDSERGRLLIRYHPGEPGNPGHLKLVESPLPTDPLAHPGRGLTQRQAEVLRWIARGKSDGEIAALIGIAPATVSKHVEHILKRLGVGTRIAAVAAVRAGQRL